MNFQATLSKQIVLSVISTILLLLLGCATSTKPNPSIIDESYKLSTRIKAEQNFLAAKSILNEISSKNELLAIELGKLPELQDGISVKERQALETLHRIYVDTPDKFDKAFEEMYKIGKPDVRKYCSLLQALFWLAENNELSTDNNLLVNYSLQRLLANAWKFDPLSYRLMSETQTKEVIDGIQIEHIKKEYLDDLYGGATYSEIQHSLVADYNRSRRTGLDTFSRKASEIIRQNLISPKAAPRWQDFSVVIDRLNAPELVDYYEKRQFKWLYSLAAEQKRTSIRYLFKYNKGDCITITRFTVLCLSRGGYKVREMPVRSPSGIFQYHYVCVLEMNGKKYVMDNGRPDPYGIIPWDLYIYK